MIVATLLILFFFLIVAGAPIAVALGASTVVTSLIFAPIPPAIIGQKIFANLDHFSLMAVPFFFFAAAFMESGGLVARLVRLANALVGHWKGGLGVTAVLSCMFFAAISGSSPATVAGVGRIMFPALIKEGYSKDYAIGAIATAGSIGILIPPSIPLILYGFVTETSITRLFIAGIVPGLMYGFGMMVMARILAGRLGYEPRARVDWPERGRSFLIAGPALTLPLVIFVGIYGFPEFTLLGFHYSGGAIFTPTEAAIVATMLAIVIGLYVYREHSIRSLGSTIAQTAPRVGMIFWVAANAILFGFFVTSIGLPDQITQIIVAANMPPWLFLLTINLVLVVVGFFMEGVPVILMFVPLLFPAAVALGIDPVHFGIIIVVNIELGLITPPVGLNLFVGSSIANMPVLRVFKACLPWSLVTVIMLIIVTYIPEVSLFLPGLMK
jgi:C4-dicarboxylate transporter DctM subunit